MRIATFFVLAATLLGSPAQSFSDTKHPAPSPYTALTLRAVKSLSDQEISDLRAGRGMGLALAAELNGYPGPLHALELADALELAPSQRMKTQAVLASMKARTTAIGDKIIAEETRLDSLFAGRTIDPKSLAASTAAIGRLRGALRAAHLSAHLAMIDIMTSQQISRYAELRGYKSSHGNHGSP